MVPADYQVRAATTATAWARWTPRLPTTGYYQVYLRWTAGSDRASSVPLTVGTALGSYKRSVNQQINGSRWNYVGQYYFRAGYSPSAGSLTLSATGANGWVVADAVMFVPV